MRIQIIKTIGQKHDGPIGVELEDKGFIIVVEFTYTLGTSKNKGWNCTALSSLLITKVKLYALSQVFVR